MGKLLEQLREARQTMLAASPGDYKLTEAIATVEKLETLAEKVDDYVDVWPSYTYTARTLRALLGIAPDSEG